MKVQAQKALVVICGVAAVILFTATMSVLVSRPTHAKPEFAAQTGLPCGRCHVNPAGGGKLKAFGEKFQANGNKLKK